MTKQEFITLVNTKRKESKNAWIFLGVIVDNKHITYKAFGTWVQVLNVGDIRHGSVMGLNVKDYLSFLNDALY